PIARAGTGPYWYSKPRTATACEPRRYPGHDVSTYSPGRVRPSIQVLTWSATWMSVGLRKWAYPFSSRFARAAYATIASAAAARNPVQSCGSARRTRSATSAATPATVTIRNGTVTLKYCVYDGV